MSMFNPSNQTLVTGGTAEVQIGTGLIVLHALIPGSTTSGTVTVRDAAAIGGSNVVHTAAIGLLQSGKIFGPFGIVMQAGLTVQPSNAGDDITVVWSPK